MGDILGALERRDVVEIVRGAKLGIPGMLHRSARDRDRILEGIRLIGDKWGGEASVKGVVMTFTDAYKKAQRILRRA